MDTHELQTDHYCNNCNAEFTVLYLWRKIEDISYCPICGKRVGHNEIMCRSYYPTDWLRFIEN
jgi:hypothetical protein